MSRQPQKPLHSCFYTAVCRLAIIDCTQKMGVASWFYLVLAGLAPWTRGKPLLRDPIFYIWYLAEAPVKLFSSSGKKRKPLQCFSRTTVGYGHKKTIYMNSNPSTHYNVIMCLVLSHVCLVRYTGLTVKQLHESNNLYIGIRQLRSTACCE